MIKHKFNAKEEIRSLGRVKVDVTRELSAQLIVNSKTYTCRVDDFHFKSIKVSSDDFKAVTGQERFGPVLIRYGNKVIGQCETLRFIRKENDSALVLDFENSDDGRGLRNKNRLLVKSSFHPIVIAIDNVKIGTVINFDIINLSSGGLLLSSSLSNRHILRGYQFDNAQIILPGLGICVASFKIQHVSLSNSQMKLGAEFTSLSSESIEMLAQFALYGTLPPANGKIDKKFSDVKENVAPIRHLGNSVRVEIVTSPVDYYNALRIRWEAYKAAHKIQQNTTLEGMADQYDSHSIVLVARVDGAVVGTARMVECKKSDLKFPFEEYFDFSVVGRSSNRVRYYEISRLAVDPKFQGTDILVKLFKEISRITAINRGMTCVCLATRALRKIYLRVGAEVITPEVPHPVLKGESLALLRFNSREILQGKGLSAHAWNAVIKEVYNNLVFANVVNVKPNMPKMNFLFAIEKILLRVNKAIKKNRRKKEG